MMSWFSPRQKIKLRMVGGKLKYRDGNLASFLKGSINYLVGDKYSVFFNSILVLVSGSLVSRVVTLAAIPVLTRLYKPEDFGVLALFVAWVALLGPFSTLRYHVAIPLPKNDFIAFHIFVLALFLSISLAVVSLLVVAFCGGWIFSRLSASQLSEYGWLIVLGIFFSSIYEVFSMWALRFKRINLIAKTQIWQSFLGSTVKIAAGFLNFIPGGLLLGHVFQQSGGVLSLVAAMKNDAKRKKFRIRYKVILYIIKRYSGFPKFRLPSQVLLAVSNQAPILLVAFFFGSETTGQFSLALLAISIPFGLISQAVARVYYTEIASLGVDRKREMAILTIELVKKLSVLAIPPVMVLMFLGPVLFSLVFGKGWDLAGEFSQALSIYIFMQFISAPFMHIFTVFERHKQFILLNTIRVILVLVVFLCTKILKLDATSSIIFFSIAMATHYALCMVVGYSLIKVGRK